MHRPKSQLLILAALGLASGAAAEVTGISARQRPVQPPTPAFPHTASYPAPPRDRFTERHIQAKHQARRK